MGIERGRRMSDSVAQATQELHDAHARQFGRTNFTQPIVLEAGAGTGKTAVLVARIVHWCMGPGWQRHQSAELHAEVIAERVALGVVAITFTDAAAVEMQVRVAKALHQLHRGTPPEWMPISEFALDSGQLAERSAALLAAVDRLRVQTIHSFCSSLLRDHALSIGLHPSFEIDADGRRLETLVLDFIGSKLEQLYGKSADANAVLLASSGKGPAALAKTLQSLAQSSVDAVEIPEDPFRFEAVLEVAQNLRTLTDRTLAVFTEVLPLRSKKDTANSKSLDTYDETLRLFIHGLDRVCDRPDIDDLQHLFGHGQPGELLLETKVIKWAKGDFTKTESGCLNELQQAQLQGCFKQLLFVAKQFSKIDVALLRAACALVRPLLADLRMQMRRSGLQTYNDLMNDTRRLLRTHPQVCSDLSAGMDQLLVDEFQDTDALQCELLQRLVLDPMQQGQAAPGLFLVGDPKQSIYGWRSADLMAYHEFVSRVKTVGGLVHLLDVNFRSVAPILAEVERCVSGIMVEEEGLQPGFQTLLPAPSALGDEGFQDLGRAAVEHWVSWGMFSGNKKSGAETRNGPAREIEAAGIARDLRELHDAGKLKWSDAAILMRATSALETYLSALRQAEIPFQVERDRSYYKRREIIDAAALMRTIVDPNDHLALVTLLRSPFVGVPDGAWLPLWEQGFPDKISRLTGPGQTDLLSEIVALIQATAGRVNQLDIPGLERIQNWHHSLLYAIRALAKLRQSFHLQPADEFVDQLRDTFLSEATEAARFLGAHRLANLERFFQRLQDSLSQEDGGPQAVLRILRRAVAEEFDQAEAAPGDESLDAVRVMTIHKAKGLTFSHVYLVNTHANKPPSSGNPQTEIFHQQDQHECCLFGFPSLGWAKVELQRERVAAAEAVRLLYVALTRPQKRLVITGRRQPAKPAQAPEVLGNAEGLLRNRPNTPDLLTAFQTSRGQTFELTDSSAVRWFFPGPAEVSDLSPLDQTAEAKSDPAQVQTTGAHSTQGKPRFSLTQALQGLEILSADRKTARDWQKQAFLGTASGMVSHEDLRLRHQGGEEQTSVYLNLHDGDRELAMGIGTAVHRALEQIDLSALPEDALEFQIEQLPISVCGLVAEQHLDEIVIGARGLLRQIDNNGMLHELFERRTHILGREVPVLLPGSPQLDAVGVMTGTLDLLYRDPNDGQLVVADFKTDQIADDASLQLAIQRYLPQGRVYCSAVRSMFPDLEPPRFELWFLAAGTIANA
jgi:ATP-dependent exoDNAse (exonuclease V) beta subunit